MKKNGEISGNPYFSDNENNQDKVKVKDATEKSEQELFEGETNEDFSNVGSQHEPKKNNRFFEWVEGIPDWGSVFGHSFLVKYREPKVHKIHGRIMNDEMSIELLEYQLTELKGLAEEHGFDSSSQEKEISQKIEEKRQKIEKNETKMNKMIVLVESNMKERARFANNIISRCEEKTAPLDDTLKRLEGNMEYIESEIGKMKERHKSKSKEIDKIMSKMRTQEIIYETKGMSKRDLRKALKILEQSKRNILNVMYMEIDFFDEKKRAISYKINDINTKADPYKDKRNKYARLTREISVGIDRAEKTDEANTGTTESETNVKCQIDMDNMKASSYIHLWNEYLKDRYWKGTNKTINEDKIFWKGSTIEPDEEINFSQFRELVSGKARNGYQYGLKHLAGFEKYLKKRQLIYKK